MNPAFLNSLFVSIIALVSCAEIGSGQSPEQESPIHLFILSGQSNMAGLDPEASFTPILKSKFGDDSVIVIKDAQGGQPIRRWYKDWKGPGQEQPDKLGDLYDRLMKKVEDVADTKVATITFVWMQGERDAREKNGDVYAASLLGLIHQLEKDLKRDDINVVIGRLSDFSNDNQRYAHWTKVREAQVKIGESDPRFAWVDTDDLNGSSDDLHYTKDGYRVLGKRFADKAIELIERAK